MIRLLSSRAGFFVSLPDPETDHVPAVFAEVTLTTAEGTGRAEGTIIDRYQDIRFCASPATLRSIASALQDYAEEADERAAAHNLPAAHNLTAGE
jgi:hypothetical protein